MADLKNTEVTETQPWAVKEILLPYDLNDEPWAIEENAPFWPDGVRMYFQDTRVISDTVAAVLKALDPSGQFRDGQHVALEMAIWTRSSTTALNRLRSCSTFFTTISSRG